MKVLVLDDHDGFREEVLAMLSRHHHEGIGVNNAPAAIPLAERGGFDFVLVDYSMPEHDGIWFLKNAKLPPQTRALLVTARVERPVINAMFQAGACGYIIKPFDEADLMRHMEFHTRRAAGRTRHERQEPSP